MAATTEVLPAGNEWQFSERNAFVGLKPGSRRRDVTQLRGSGNEVVKHIQQRFVLNGWNLVAVVEDSQRVNLRTPPHLLIVFSQPSRVALSRERTYDIDQFIKSEAREAALSTDSSSFRVEQIPIADDPINQVLRGTNFVVEGISARYNVINIDQGAFLQTGVGYFDLDLVTTAQAITSQDRIIEEKMKKIRPLQREKEALLALQSTNPVPLFQ